MYNYDVFKGVTDSGLKTLEAFMGNDIEETSVPFDIDRPLTDKEIFDTIHYCEHDVDQLMKVFELRIDDFNTHLAMINEFKLSLNNLSKTYAQLISVILGSSKRSYDDEWDVYLPDNLKLGKYKAVGDWFLTNKTAEPLIYNICGVEHIFADGGLHGKDLSKADVSVNIYAFLKAQETGKPVELCCAIGDDTIDGKPYSEIVDIAREYINSVGGFEKFAEWGLY